MSALSERSIDVDGAYKNDAPRARGVRGDGGTLEVSGGRQKTFREVFFGRDQTQAAVQTGCTTYRDNVPVMLFAECHRMSALAVVCYGATVDHREPADWAGRCEERGSLRRVVEGYR